MKRNKSIFFLSIIAALGLAGCSLSDVKGFFRDNLVNPIRALISGQKQEENKDNQKQEGSQSGEQGGQQQGGEQGGQQGGGEQGGGEQDNTPAYEKGDKKAEDGAGLMFSETIGFNTKDATVLEENSETRYVIYASNETAKGKQVFAARKATKENGAWKYHEKHIILRPNADENAWDQAIFQPSVIKGKFNLTGTEYHYLMAYQGNEDGTNYNNHIGLAVTNDILGEWVRVGNAPILENPELFENSFGFGSPELVSYDNEGLAYLFYSFGETTLSGTRVKTANFADLDHIQLEAGYAELPVTGLIGRDDSITSNAGFAISQDGKLYYAGDGMPDSNAPGCATSFEVAKANLDIIQKFDEQWTSIEKLTGLDTMDEDKLGWDELFSPTFVRDEYGKVDTTAGKLEVVYSTFDVDSGDASYTGQLALHVVNLD